MSYDQKQKSFVFYGDSYNENSYNNELTDKDQYLQLLLNTKTKQNIPCDMFGSWEYHENETWIQTYTGRRFNPTKPIIDSIVLEDIAHPLSMQCRFSGHLSCFYSVAQHSVLTSYICDKKDQLHALLHDASEAYIVDIPRPIKRKLKEYVSLEKVMQDAIFERFNLSKKIPESVKKADDIILETEARDLS